jgi:hypothetical protein
MDEASRWVPARTRSVHRPGWRLVLELRDSVRDPAPDGGTLAVAGRSRQVGRRWSDP